MCGVSDAVYLAPLKLADHSLPWVEHANHLGHELCNMDYDAEIKRVQFIDSSVRIRETFHFARPEQFLQAVRTYSGTRHGIHVSN